MITTTGLVAMSRQTISAPDTIIMAIAIVVSLGIMLGLIMLAARRPYSNSPYPPGQGSGPAQGEVLFQSEIRADSAQEAQQEGAVAHADTAGSGTARGPGPDPEHPHGTASPSPAIPGQAEHGRKREQQAEEPAASRGGGLL